MRYGEFVPALLLVLIAYRSNWVLGSNGAENRFKRCDN